MPACAMCNGPLPNIRSYGASCSRRCYNRRNEMFDELGGRWPRSNAYDVLATHWGEWFTPDRVASYVDRTPENVRQSLARLASAGWVEKRAVEHAFDHDYRRSVDSVGGMSQVAVRIEYRVRYPGERVSL